LPFFCNKVERCFDIVAKNGNNVEATFDIVEATFDIVAFDNVASTLLLVWTGLTIRHHALVPSYQYYNTMVHKRRATLFLTITPGFLVDFYTYGTNGNRNEYYTERCEIYILVLTAS